MYCWKDPISINECSKLESLCLSVNKLLRAAEENFFHWWPQYFQQLLLEYSCFNGEKFRNKHFFVIFLHDLSVCLIICN